MKVMISGIYTITNLVNGKIYVGFANNFSARWYSHKFCLNRNKHENDYLQKSWNKYGAENFKFERIEICKKEKLAEREHYWAKLLDSNNKKIGYNIRLTDPNGRCLHSDDSKKKMSKIQKILCSTVERREEYRKRMLGKRYGKGHVITPENRIKINEAHKRRRIHPEKKKRIEGDKQRSQVAIDKLRERNKGNKYGEGRVKSAYELEKMRMYYYQRKSEGWVSPLKDKKRSDELKRKITETKSKKSYKGINQGIIRNNLRKKVIAYNLDESVYKKFDSLRDALIHFDKKPDSTSHLTRGLKNTNKIVYGKKWKYASTNN